MQGSQTPSVSGYRGHSGLFVVTGRKRTEFATINACAIDTD